MSGSYSRRRSGARTTISAPVGGVSLAPAASRLPESPREVRPPVLLHVTTVPSTLSFLRGQVQYMQKHGLTVCAASSPGPDLRRFGAEYGIAVYAIPMERRVTPTRDLVALWRLARLMRCIRPDIVHAHTPKGGLLGMLAARLAAVPGRVYHMRGLPFMGARGVRWLLLRFTERAACTLATRVIAVGQSIREVAVGEGLCAADKICVLAGGSGQGVDARLRFNPERLEPATRSRVRATLGIPEDAFVVGFVGRVVRDKGIADLTEAWQAVRGLYPRAHLVVVGPFEDQDPLPRQVEGRLRADPTVHLVGLDWDTPPYYAAMDVLALPSYREGFPNVPLEAAAMGVPVIVSDAPGCRDSVVHDVTGTHVPVGDAAALSAAICAYIRDPALARLHGENGRRRAVSTFVPEEIWKAMFLEYVEQCARLGR